MSDDLFDHLKNKLSDTSIPDTEQSWRHMQALLDRTSFPSRPAIVIRWWYAAASILLIGFTSWAMYHTLSGTVLPIVHAIPSNTSAIKSTHNPSRPLSAAAPATPGRPASSAGLGYTSAPSDTHTESSSSRDDNGTESNPTVQTRSYSLVPSESVWLQDDPRRAIFPTRLLQSQAKSPTADIQIHHRPSRWGMEIGLGANTPGSFVKITSNNHTSWKPGIYPVAYLRYRLSPKWSVRAGLALPSPVTYAKTLTQSNLIVVTDTLNNRNNQTIAEQNKIGRLVYMDIPVTLQWGALSHVSLAGGVQLSYLLSQQEDTHSETDMSPRFVPYSPPPLTNISSRTFQKTPAPSIRKTDPRFLLGVNYQWHRFSAGVQYQAGLTKSTTQTDDQGNSCNSRTNILKMQMVYSLW